MMQNFGLTKYSLLCALLLVDRALFLPAPAARSSSASNSHDKRPSKLVEIKLPVKITSMEDLIAWAKNAMRSMASRIDITLASVDEPVDTKRERSKPSKPSPKEARPRQREPVSLSFETRRPATQNALLSTFATLLNPDSSFDSLIDDENYLRSREDSLYGNVNAYVPLLFEDLEIAKYREEALKKYYIEQAKRDKDGNGGKDRPPVRYTQAIAQQTSHTDLSESKVKPPSSKNKDTAKPAPVISVPFEAVVTITRENAPEPTRKTFEDTRDPPDEFPPYFEKEYPRREAPLESELSKKTKGTAAPKRQLGSLGDLLRVLGITRRLTTTRKDANRTRGTNSATTNSKQRKPAAIFTPPPPPIIEFEDDPPQKPRNETSQKQEDYDDEEEMGSLGSLNDLLPLVIPILEDLSDPESDTDLSEVLEAALPLLEGLSMDNPDDPDTPNILRLIGPILDTILGGKDGQGSDFGALLGPLLQIVGPLVGPLSGPLSAASSGGGGEGGSTVASLLQASIGPLAQPGPDGTSPISTITAKILTTIIRDLRVGQPGGSDIGALIGSVLTGVIGGTSAGLSGTSSSDKGAQPYGPYGPYGPAQAGSVNKRTTTGYVVPGQQTHSFQQIIPFDQHSIPVPVNILGHHRIGHHTTQRPYINVPQRVYPVPQPPPLQNFIQHHQTGPVQAETTNADSGGSSYLPYGNNGGVPAGSANPLGLVGSAIKDILGGGIGLLSSVINAVFGISGSSSAEKPRPSYGPPNGGYH